MSPYYFERNPFQLGDERRAMIDRIPKPLGPSQPEARQQFDWGGAINAGLAGASLIGNAVGQSQQGLGIDTSLPEQNPYGQPVYQGGQLAGQLNNAKPQKTSFGEVASGALQGAQAGSQFGPIGTGVGAAVGLASSLIGGRRRKKRQEREKRQAQQRLAANQQSFNQSDVAYRNQQLQMQEYNDKMNDEARTYNLYRSQY